MVNQMLKLPFNNHYSLLMAKSEAGVIIDLSCPIGASANQDIPDNYFDFFCVNLNTQQLIIFFIKFVKWS